MSAPAHEAVLEFEYEHATTAAVIVTSVAREVGEIDDDRSQTRIDRRGRTVEVTVEARDVTALRAALNTWFMLVDVAERAVLIGERFRSDVPIDDRSDGRASN